MKIYYTTDGSIDDDLEQVCPYDEEHHFTRFDGTEFTMPKDVGCGGCRECPYCYGAGLSHPYGAHPKTWVMMPRSLQFKNMNFDDIEQEKVRLGTKQFRIVSLNDYIKCAKCYTEEHRNKSKKLKLKLWWWHHYGLKLYEVRGNIWKWCADTKYNIQDTLRKLHDV